MKFGMRTTAVAVLSVATFAVAPAAMANSFSGGNGGGSYSYDDGHDQFCVHALDRAQDWISVTLTPVDRSRGPVKTVGAEDGGSQCASLATAYEDTKYVAHITGFNSAPKNVTFYS